MGQAEVYRDLRALAFGNTAQSLGLKDLAPEAAFGVLMETGYPKAVVTLASFLSGDASLYFSGGGGILGSGGHAPVSEAAKAFVRKCDEYRAKMTKVVDCPSPAIGDTVFYVMTGEGVFSHSEREEDLGRRRSEFTPLFYAAQDVITQIRLLQEG